MALNDRSFGPVSGTPPRRKKKPTPSRRKGLSLSDALSGMSRGAAQQLARSQQVPPRQRSRQRI